MHNHQQPQRPPLPRHIIFHCNLPSSFFWRTPYYGIKRTLNGSLSTDRRGQTHGTGHEVGEDLVRARRLLGLVLAEIRDLHGRALGGSKRTVERRRFGGISNPPLLLAGGDSGAGGGGKLLASARAQQGTGSGGESHGE